jgi:hypothetical protein
MRVNYIISDAIFSPCEAYRYALFRIWDESLPLMGWILLKPNMADSTTDDLVVKRCVGFAQAWSYGSIMVGSLFAMRSGWANDIYGASDPVGPLNDAYLTDMRDCALVVAAWGNHGSHQRRDRRVMNLLRGYPLQCLGVTQEGQPNPPLYLPKRSVPVPYRPGERRPIGWHSTPQDFFQEAVNEQTADRGLYSRDHSRPSR